MSEATFLAQGADMSALGSCEAEIGAIGAIIAPEHNPRPRGSVGLFQVVPGIVPPLTKTPYHETVLGMGALAVGSVAYPLRG